MKTELKSVMTTDLEKLANTIEMKTSLIDLKWKVIPTKISGFFK